MTENEKTNTKSITNGPLFNAGMSIFEKKPKKPNQTNHPNKPQTNQMKYGVYG